MRKVFSILLALYLGFTLSVASYADENVPTPYALIHCEQGGKVITSVQRNVLMTFPELHFDHVDYYHWLCTVQISTCTIHGEFDRTLLSKDIFVSGDCPQ